jgi:hypothetical protein
MKRLLISLLLAAFAATASAGNWTPPITVTSAFTEDSDILAVYTSDTTVYVPGCGGGTWMYSVASPETRKARVWATILAAIAAGHKVSFWYQDSCATWGFHHFTAVKIVPQ